MKYLSLPIALCLGFLPGLARAQIQTHALVSPDAVSQTELGTSGGISGDWIVLGGPWSPEASNGLGAIWFYQRQDSSWVQTQHLAPNPPLPLSNFGYTTAIDGDIAAASAPGAPAGGFGGAGRIYIFERVGQIWTQTAILSANDPHPSGFLGGSSLAISGTRILAGTDQDNHAGSNTGAAYLFEKVTGTWMQTAKLVASDGATAHFFGRSVAIDGNTIVVGAPKIAGPAGAQQGAVYVFEQQGGTWLQTQKLVHSFSTASDSTGAGIALRSETIAAYAVTQSFRGAVYLFQKVNGTWVDDQRLISSDGKNGDNFGVGVSMTEDLMLLGSTGNGEQADLAGAAYCFRKIGSQWVQAGKFLRHSASQADWFGAVTGISGGMGMVCAPKTDQACPSNQQCNSGSAYIFSLPIDALQFGSCAENSPCNNWSLHGGCFNSTGKGALVASGGSGSVSADDLVIEASRLPANVFGIYFMGAAQTSTPLGDGLRVVAPGAGSSLYRFGAQQVGPEGRATLGPGIVAQSQSFPPAGMIQPGRTWNFQFWYRDALGPCGNGTNVTNGVSVSFVP